MKCKQLLVFNDDTVVQKIAIACIYDDTVVQKKKKKRIKHMFQIYILASKLYQQHKL